MSNPFKPFSFKHIFFNRYPNVAKQNESFAELLAFTSQLGRLIDYTYNSSLRNHPFLEAFDSQLNNTQEIIKIMKMVIYVCYKKNARRLSFLILWLVFG